MSGKIRINGEGLAQLPKSNDHVELRWVADGRTISAVVEVETILTNAKDIGARTLHLLGMVRSVVVSNFDDGRLDRQLASINRLLAHLEKHCPEFISGQACEHNGKLES